MPLKKALFRGWGVTFWVKYLPAIGAQACNPSSWKKAGRSEVQGYLPLYLGFQVGIGILRPCLQNNIIWLINLKIKKLFKTSCRIWGQIRAWKTYFLPL